MYTKVFFGVDVRPHLPSLQRNSPSPFLEILYLPPLRYLIQLYRAHQISVGHREQISWDEYGPTIQVLHNNTINNVINNMYT